jgi:hypothetical protein
MLSKIDSARQTIKIPRVRGTLTEEFLDVSISSTQITSSS